MAHQYEERVDFAARMRKIKEKNAKPIPTWGQNYSVYWYEEEDDEVHDQSS